MIAEAAVRPATGHRSEGPRLAGPRDEPAGGLPGRREANADAMSREVVYGRLRATDPARWSTAGASWRALAGPLGQRAADLDGDGIRLADGWSGAAARAAAAGLAAQRRRLQLIRVTCWQVDQALSEFASALARARALLDAATAAARRVGAVIDDRGTLRVAAALDIAPGTAGAASDIAPGTAGAASEIVRGAALGAAPGTAGALLDAALRTAAAADAEAAARLEALAAATVRPGTPPPTAGPPCGAPPADVRRWWDTLTPAQRRWLVVAEPEVVGPLDGVPAAYRDAANRLVLDDRRVALDRAVAAATGATARRLRAQRAGLDALVDRLGSRDGQRAYLLRLDLAGDGRVVVALGDPDRARHVLTHVPGMGSGLATQAHELTHAERVADSANRLTPGEQTSAVLWLDYDAPDVGPEAAGRGLAAGGAAALRRFQDGLRAAHDGPQPRLTVLGHSYGSLVVGAAAARPGLAADAVVFVGSPGVGVDSAARLHAPEVWSTTSLSDPIQYAAVALKSLPGDIALSAAVPGLGPLLAFGRPERDLWFGRNPSDPAFGAHVFASQPGAGHTGYWEPGRPALEALADIAVGWGDVIPR
jgi:Alpha/beta hydrolase